MIQGSTSSAYWQLRDPCNFFWILSESKRLRTFRRSIGALCFTIGGPLEDLEQLVPIWQHRFNQPCCLGSSRKRKQRITQTKLWRHFWMLRKSNLPRHFWRNKKVKLFTLNENCKFVTAPHDGMIRGRFHQHFTSSFNARRSQKRKKRQSSC